MSGYLDIINGTGVDLALGELGNHLLTGLAAGAASVVVSNFTGTAYRNASEVGEGMPLLQSEKASVHLAPNAELEAQFQEFIRRVPHAQHLEHEINVLQGDPSTKGKVTEFLEAFERGDVHSPAFMGDEFPYYGLIAMREGKINPLQAGTICQIWSAIQAHKGAQSIQVLNFFNEDGSYNPVAVDYLRASIHLTGLWKPFSDEDFNKLLEAMRERPKSEQRIFILPDRHGENLVNSNSILGRTASAFFPSVFAKYYQANVPIVNDIQFSIGFGVFNRLIRAEDNQTLRVLAPMELMQEFLNQYRGENALQLNPVVGLSSVEDIRQNGLDGTRDIAVHFPGVILPDRADSLYAPDGDFTYHDFYHAAMASGVPAAHRKLLIRISDICQEVFDEMSDEEREVKGPGVQSIREIFLDMEHSHYTYNSQFNIEDLFWGTVAEGFNILRAQYFRRAQLDEETTERIMQAIVTRLDLGSAPDGISTGPQGFQKIEAFTSIYNTNEGYYRRCREFTEKSWIAAPVHFFCRQMEGIFAHYKNMQPIGRVVQLWSGRKQMEGK